MILALDTSGGELVAATLDDQLELREGTVIPGRRHQERVLEVLDEVLKQSGGVGALTAVAVVRGPGSQTGLRVGLATAEGLAFARRLRIFPLSSLAVAAHRAAGGDTILAAVSAGRSNFHVRPFARSGLAWRASAPAQLLPVAEVLARHGGLAIAGEPAVLQVLTGEGMEPAPTLRPGVEALVAASREAVSVGEGVAYDQLTGDY